MVVSWWSDSVNESFQIDIWLFIMNEYLVYCLFVYYLVVCWFDCSLGLYVSVYHCLCLGSLSINSNLRNIFDFGIVWFWLYMFYTQIFCPFTWIILFNSILCHQRFQNILICSYVYNLVGYSDFIIFVIVVLNLVTTNVVVNGK